MTYAIGRIGSFTRTYSTDAEHRLQLDGIAKGSDLLWLPLTEFLADSEDLVA